ncbi:hypothetical protein AKJ18_10765 [Vibrio xuii]|nr:hypothetical protein AKJ18_10765 [Vibrio xuii]
MKPDLDLNLLVVLVLMNEYRQLKPVAKALGKTESAVSKYLAKLRGQLGDPLFIRNSREFEPTDFLSNLLPSLTSGLDSIQSAVSGQKFDPKSYTNDIVIAIPSSVQYRIGARLMIDLFACFPKAKIYLVDWQDNSKNDIFEGRIDVGLHYLNSELPKSIYQHEIGRLTTAVLTRKDVNVSNFDDLLKMPFVTLTTKGRVSREAETKILLEKKGINIDVRGAVDDLTCLLTILRESGYASIVHNFGDSIDGFNITPFPKSLGLELPKVVVNYRLSNRGNPLHELLVNRIQFHLIQ